MEERRAVDPILSEIKAEVVRSGKSIDRLDSTVHGNGKMGLKTRTMILWYGAIGLASVLGLILTGCAVFLR